MRQTPLAFPEAASVRFLTEPIGLYLHIPFCKKRCTYCNFYSSFLNEELMDKYTASLIAEIKKWGGAIHRPIDTVYLGGGTPALLNHRLKPILDSVRDNFSLDSSAEITLEINPANNIEEILQNAKNAGVNRISIGVQSGIDRELKLLGRTHSSLDAENVVKTARAFKFNNISVDLMLGLPESNLDTLKQSLDFLMHLDPDHISAYILKIEPNTAFFAHSNTLNLPDDDMQAEQYLYMCRFLKELGFRHYEISNFCKKNMQSRHNTKYWRCEEYLGLGASAHSFLEGKRFYYPNDLKAFIDGCNPIPDGEGGDIGERIMLALRLDEGYEFKDEINGRLLEKLQIFRQNGLVCLQGRHLKLTERGMLVSNTVITEILEEIL